LAKTQKGEIKIMSYPAWRDMTADQKFEFLHEWCGNLTRKVDQQEHTIQLLHERLRAAEAKMASQTS
jgi:hypothetical protein